jgi:hypothetical protein
MGSSSMTSMLMPLLMNKKLKEELHGHKHDTTGAAVMPASSSDALSSMLPLLMFMPGIFGGSSTTAASSKEPDAFSNPIVMMILMDAL